MPDPTRPTQFGSIHAPDEAWLATQPSEPILDPDLGVIDTHHHLWERPDHRYLIHEFLDDVRDRSQCGGHGLRGMPRDVPGAGAEGAAGGRPDRVRGRHGGHERQRPLRTHAGGRGDRGLRRPHPGRPRRAGAAGAHPGGGGRFRGVRHSAAWDASAIIGNSQTATGPHLMQQPDFRAGLARLAALGLSLDALGLSPAARRHRRPRARVSPCDHHRGPRGRAPRLRPLRGPSRRGLHALEGRGHRAGRNAPTPS